MTSSATAIAPAREPRIGFAAGTEPVAVPLAHDVLAEIYANAPGLVSDKPKATLEFAWERQRTPGAEPDSLPLF